MSLDFCRWEQASLLFLGYTLVCAVLSPGLAPRARSKTAAVCAAGVAVVFLSASLPRSSLSARFLLLPPIVLFIAYWTSGMLFRAPMPRIEAFLRSVDAGLRIRRTAASAPRVTAELLELAYAFVYVLVPIAFAIHLTVTPAAEVNADRFWTVILVTDFICFGLLPWIQLRPPRALEGVDPWRSSFRTVNLRMLGVGSIHVNTCPSGHAAEALAAALLVANAPTPVFTGMVVAALAVSAGAVYGRYHYAVDAVGGWIVAVIVWAVTVRLTLT